MACTGTLSYPYILANRQVILNKYCKHGGINDFQTTDFGFRILAPEGQCILPHRSFPKDTSIQVLPAGKYSVINEYAKGTIIDAARATILFEHITSDRNPKEILARMRLGGFLDNAQVTEFTNKNGLHVFLAKNTIGIDGVSHFDWAFITHPNKDIMFTMITAHPESPEVFDYVLENLSPMN